MLLFDVNRVILSSKKQGCVGPSQVLSSLSTEQQPYCQEAPATNMTPFLYLLPKAHLGLSPQRSVMMLRYPQSSAPFPFHGLNPKPIILHTE